jgi:hypothetical protein
MYAILVQAKECTLENDCISNKHSLAFGSSNGYILFHLNTISTYVLSYNSNIFLSIAISINFSNCVFVAHIPVGLFGKFNQINLILEFFFSISIILLTRSVFFHVSLFNKEYSFT